LKFGFVRETQEAARRQWRDVADALREKFEKLAAMIDGSCDEVLAYMTFPREHWPQIGSTNPIERVNREIKRRADVVGIFPNDAAAVRLVGALMLETNNEWAVSRRYMTLEPSASSAIIPSPDCPSWPPDKKTRPCRDRCSYTTSRGTTRLRLRWSPSLSLTWTQRGGPALHRVKRPDGVMHRTASRYS